jgi:hypothetical protein
MSQPKFTMMSKPTISFGGGPPIECTHIQDASCIENAKVTITEFKPGSLLSHKPECECVADGVYEVTYHFTYGEFETVVGLPLPKVRFPTDRADALGNDLVVALWKVASEWNS